MLLEVPEAGFLFFLKRRYNINIMDRELIVELKVRILEAIKDKCDSVEELSQHLKDLYNLIGLP